MKIFEYRPFLGGLSLGLEHFAKNEVVEVLKLPKIATYSYNNTHKQWFLPDFTQIQDYETKKDYDLAILNPDLGDKIARKGKKNFKIDEIFQVLEFLEREKPKFAIITVDIDAIPRLNIAKDYVRDGFNQLSMDLVVDRLQKMGYKAHLVAINEADYGVPVQKQIAMYIATPEDFNLNFPKGEFSRYGRGKHRRYRTIADAIGDLGDIGEWSPYLTAPQNAYQRYIRRGMPKVTWHFLKRKVRQNQVDVISHIRQGSNAKKTASVKQQAGYNRPKWDRACPLIDEKFYMVSSQYMSIHPIADRPFTIREGMRIMGLPDTISFELGSSNKDVANLIVNSISPIIGEYLAIALRTI